MYIYICHLNIYSKIKNIKIHQLVNSKEKEIQDIYI